MIVVLSRIVIIWKLDSDQLLVSQGRWVVDSHNYFISAFVDWAVKNRIILSTNASLHSFGQKPIFFHFSQDLFLVNFRTFGHGFGKMLHIVVRNVLL